MKILGLSDIHIKETATRNRIDNYYETQFGKLEWGLNLGIEKKVDIVLFAGDITHTVRASYKSIIKLINLFKRFGKDRVFTVLGQHDSRLRNLSTDNVPMGVLESANVITVLNSSPIVIDNVHLYGSSYGEEIPEIKDESVFNVLSIHKMVIKEKLWEAQTDFIQANILLRKHKFDLILSGDNHTFFTEKFKDRHLLNLGSIMRMTSLQIEHIPQCVIFDTDTRNFEIFTIPHKSAEVVFDLNKIEKEKTLRQENEKIKEYVELLAMDEETIQIKFEDNILGYIKKHGLNKNIEKIILKAIGTQDANI